MQILKQGKKKKGTSYTKRGVSKKTIAIVNERDKGCCVLCGRSYPLERVPHHVYYGGQANRGTNRNDPDQLVTICLEEHTEIHDKGNQDKRRQCIIYLELQYGITNYNDN